MTPAQNAKNARLATVTVTSTYQILVTDSEVDCNATSAAFTATLFSAVGNAGRVITVKNSGTANNVTVASLGGTIDGQPSFIIPIKCSMTVKADGTNWHVI
jgi:hypothetical protein